MESQNQTVNNFNNSQTENTPVQSSSEVSLSEKAKPKKRGLGVDVLAKPNRILPNIIEELLEKEIPVTLAKDGYYVGGFYGLNENIDKKGFAFAQETSEENTLLFVDSRNNKHLVRDFEDMVRFNNHVWGLFFKSEEYKKPDTLWFGYMLEHGVLNITPGK